MFDEVYKSHDQDALLWQPGDEGFEWVQHIKRTQSCEGIQAFQSSCDFERIEMMGGDCWKLAKLWERRELCNDRVRN
jgi:hypothetical protein